MIYDNLKNAKVIAQERLHINKEPFFWQKRNYEIILKENVFMELYKKLCMETLISGKFSMIWDDENNCVVGYENEKTDSLSFTLFVELLKNLDFIVEWKTIDPEDNIMHLLYQYKKVVICLP